MNNKDQVAVVIPALNEEKSIAEVVGGINSAVAYTVIVVDDFSSDATADLAKEAGASVIKLASGLGAWGAMQAGIRYAVLKGYKTVLTMDADGQHPTASISDLLVPIQEGQAHFTIGTCPERGSRLRHIAWWTLKRFSGLRVRDLTSGFRAYDHDAAVLLASKQASYLNYQDVGVLVLLKRCGFVGKEVPVNMRERHSGRSKIFASWGKVVFYMAYSALLSISKRGSKQRASPRASSPAGVHL